MRFPTLIGKFSSLLLSVAASAAVILPAGADSLVRQGVLSCDISAGIGLIFTSKQKINCTYTPQNGLAPEHYVGNIHEVGIELGSTSGGHLTWLVVTASLNGDVPQGALAGTYVGWSANASLGEGFGANDLSGGFNKSIVLQPYSVQTQEGANVAAGIAKVTLSAAD